MNYKLIPEDYELQINSVNNFTPKYSDCLIEVTDYEGNIAYGSDVATTAKALGCSPQSIYKCLAYPNIYKTCRGCKIRVVDSVTLKPIENKGHK